MQRDSILNPLVSDDKSQIKSKIFESKIRAIFGKKCDVQGNVLENFIALTIVFKPHYKFIKPIVDLSFMTIRSKDHTPKKFTSHS